MDGVDRTLENLLGLNGDIIYFDSGYWAKFEAERVTAPWNAVRHQVFIDAARSGQQANHGLRQRARLEAAVEEETMVVPVRPHALVQDPQPYEYTDAAALVEAFWRDVERVLRKRGVSL